LRSFAVIVSIVAVFVAIGWGFVAHPADGDWILHVSYDPTRELYRAINKAFIADRFDRVGKRVVVRQSHSGSAGQARAVNEGLPADVLSLAIPPDLDSVAKGGLVDLDWRTRLPHHATPFYSTIVFVVRVGNPKNIRDWSDLVQPGDGLQIVTPNPKTSGNGKLSLLAAWGAAIRRNKTPSEADAVVKAVLAKAPVLDASARAATATFVQKNIGDVHLTFESEAVLEVRESRTGLEIVYPKSGSLRVEPPIALVGRNATRRRTRELAEDYLAFVFSPAGQRIGAELFYRPSDPVVAREFENHLPKFEMFALEDVGLDWNAAQERFFTSGALIDQIAAELAGANR
jgi:sulfate transport system substrate-binding protein